MTKQEIIEKYNHNYTEEEYFMNNIEYAFSREQLAEAMKKLGAKDESELSSIFGIGDICLKSKKKELVHWLNTKEEEKQNWLKSLSHEELNVLVEYELRNHECDYTQEIDEVVEIFKGILSWNDIMIVYHKITKQQ